MDFGGGGRCRTFSGKGFTLSEVLITLGIIGIVAAITMPVLVGKYQDIVCRNKWKSLYSKISNAYLFVKNDLAVSDTDEMFSSIEEEYRILELIKKKLGVRIGTYENICPEGQDCSYGGGNIESYKTLYGTGMNPYSFGGYIDSDNGLNTVWYSLEGATVYFRANSFYDMFVIYIFVDVNGIQSPPNILGRDFFALVITPPGACPVGANCGYRPQYFKDSCTSEKEVYASSLNGMHHGSPISGIGCSSDMLLK